MSIKDKNINILLLGGIGVGKTTLISALKNYSRFKKIKDAIKTDKELLFKLPTHVKIFGSHDFKYEFDIGELEKNESSKSTTKICFQYNINLLNETTINIIDTPGFGDIKNDEINFKKIIDKLSNVDILHGVVLLLNQNDSRLEKVFKFCFIELLPLLHPFSKKNIYFCFTHSRSRNFTPYGSSYDALTNYLKQLEKDKGIDIKTTDKCFCVDNEGYNYLMARKIIKAEFDNIDCTLYSESWDISSLQLFSLIKTITNSSNSISQLIPINQTISIYQAKLLISKYSNKIIECIEQVENTIDILIKHKDKLYNCAISDELIELLKFKVPYLEILELPIPYLICTDKDCGTSSYKDYKLDGHLCDRIDLKVNLNSIYQRKTINLFGFCKNCNHSQFSHKIQLYINLPNNDSNRKIPNKNQTQEIERIVIEKINYYNKLLDEILFEKKQLYDSLFKFSIFLFFNSTITINHQFKNYINHKINKLNINYSKYENNLLELNQMLNNYNLFVQEIKNNNQEIINKTPHSHELKNQIKIIKKLKLSSLFFSNYKENQKSIDINNTNIN